MALPVVKNALECANFTETVSPYLYQLKPLPQIFFESATNPLALKQIYLDTNPLITAAAFSIALMPIFLVVSEVNKNYSQVDRCWSLLPTAYNVHYAIWAHMAGLKTQKLDLLLIVSTIWSVSIFRALFGVIQLILQARLTYNYWRKGGYSVGSEDYRWLIVKKKIGSTLFFLLNVTFIASIQSLLLFSITTPTYILLLTSRIATMRNESALETGDIIAAGVMLAFIGISAVSDEQQWNYQNAKQEYKKTAKIPKGYSQTELERGFLTRGLFALSRHPNFAAEQSVWVALHGWSCYSTEMPFNWSGIGALSYLLLFQGSTWLTEILSTQKYPDYKSYKEQVGMFFPTYGSHPPVFSKLTGGATPKKDAVKARERYDLR